MMLRTRKQPMTPARLMKPLLLVFVMFYIVFHTVHGERGLFAWVRERHALESLQKQLGEAKAERERVELRVSHMRDHSLDLDLLDEQMRRMMGVMKPGEVVMLSTAAPASDASNRAQ